MLGNHSINDENKENGACTCRRYKVIVVCAKILCPQVNEGLLSGNGSR